MKAIVEHGAIVIVADEWMLVGEEPTTRDITNPECVSALGQDVVDLMYRLQPTSVIPVGLEVELEHQGADYLVFDIRATKLPPLMTTPHGIEMLNPYNPQKEKQNESSKH